MKCPVCQSEVESHYKFCEKCGNNFSLNPPVLEEIPTDNKTLINDSNLTTQQLSYFIKKNPVVVALSSFALVIVMMFSFWAVRYNQLIDDIGYISPSYNPNVLKETLDDSFWGLPNFYRDVSNIREEYNFISAEYSKMTNRFNPDYETMRESYFILNDFAINNRRWGINPLLSYFNDRPLYGEWSTSCFGFNNSTYFILSSGENGPLLQTNMPNQKRTTESYYYSHSNDWKTIGYKNQANANDKFDAFTILSVNRSKLRVRNVMNSSIYEFNHCGF